MLFRNMVRLIPHRDLVRYEENNPNVIVSGSWTVSTNVSNSNSRAIYTMDTSAYVQLTFIGSGIRVIGAKNLSYGFHKIIIDGTTYTADAYASSLQFKQTIFEKTGLTYGQHTIKVLPNGTKLGSSTDTFIQIDAFEVI